MALYSKKVPIKYLTLMADSAGTLSKDSYLLVEVTGVTVSDISWVCRGLRLQLQVCILIL